jgi:hypothetical protein
MGLSFGEARHVDGRRAMVVRVLRSDGHLLELAPVEED